MWGLPRSPRWRYELLNDADEPLGELLGVEGGSLEVVALSRLGGSGELTIRDLGQEIDWMRHRVRVSYDPGVDGFEEWHVGVWLLTTPREAHDQSGRKFTVGLLPKTQAVDEDSVTDTYSLTAGVNIVSTVVALIRSTGETRIAVTPSSAVLANAQVWDAGTSKLTIVNDLLTAANYWSLAVDGEGQFRVEQYVNPADRPIVYSFVEGEASIHTPDWVREQDLSSVPNRFVVVGQGDDETPPLIGVAENTGPDSPYSFQARGRWISRTEENVELASQAAATALAQRRLTDAMSPVGRLEVTHLAVPVETNQAVGFVDSGYDGRATIQRMSYSLNLPGMVSGEWREV